MLMEDTIRTRYLGNNDVVFEKLNDFVLSHSQEKLGANPYNTDIANTSDLESDLIS